jgi:hypothetical protein
VAAASKTVQKRSIAHKATLGIQRIDFGLQANGPIAGDKIIVASPAIPKVLSHNSHYEERERTQATLNSGSDVGFFFNQA